MTGRHWVNRQKLRLLPAVRRAPRRMRRPFEWILREPGGSVDRLDRFGLVPVDVIEVAVDELLVQKPVRCEVINTTDASTLPFLDEYFTTRSGEDWRIRRSMMFKLLDQHRRTGLPQDLTATDYWQWHVALEQAGINQRPAQMITRKIQGLVRIHDSIAKEGFRYGGLRSYVWVLDRPLIASRYGYEYAPQGYEIFDGHHRAAAAAACGMHSLHVLVLRDVGTRTPFGVPVEAVSAPQRVTE